jgi:hypothetical protein
MPCYRCGTRQTDPEPGKSSPWRRGVVREHQVLVCPDCQPAALAELDRCVGCGSTHLIRRLDQVECLDCRLTRDPSAPDAVDAGDAGDTPDAASAASAPDAPDAGGGPDPALAAEVARAVARVFGRA